MAQKFDAIVIGTVTVLYAGRMHHHLQQQFRMIGQHMAFNAPDLFASVIPHRIDR